MNSRKSLWDIKTHVKQDHWFDDNASKKALPEKISYTCHKCRKRVEVDHTGVMEYQQFLLLKEFLSYIFSHSKGEYEESLPVTNNCKECIIEQYFDDDEDVFNDLMKYITINEEKSRKKEKSSESRDKLNQTVALPVIKPEEFPIPNRIIEAKRANNEYSEDFPLKVLPNNLYKKIQILTQGDPNISRKLKDKIEKWYFTYPESTMKDAFKPQPLKFLNETKLYSRKKNEFSTYVNAYFKGGVIDRPLLDPQNRFMKIQNQLGEN